MAEPARHSLFARVPRNLRYKGQNVVDTAVWRFGDLAIASSMNALRTVGVGIAGFLHVHECSDAVNRAPRRRARRGRDSRHS